MIVNQGKQLRQIEFSRLAAGKVVKSNSGRFYMKMDLSDSIAHLTTKNAVNLEDGRLVRFNAETLVTQYPDAEVILGDPR